MKKILALLLALTIMCFSFVACSDNKDETPDSQEVESTEQENQDSVKLTKENFDTYFEFVEESFFTKDSKGNYSQLRFRHYYKLKPEYNIDLSESSVKLTYSYSSAQKKVNINFNTQEFTLGEQVGDKKVLENIVIDKISQMTYKDYAIFLLQPTHASKGDTTIEYISDIELVSVEGTLHLIEANNVAHSTEDHTH